MQSGYVRIPASLDDSARMLARAARLMANVHWPLLRRSTAAAALDTLLTYTHFSRRAPSTTRPPLRMHWNSRALAAGRAIGKRRAQGYGGGMTRALGPAPSLSEIEVLARAALADLPQLFAAHLGDVLVVVEDFADEETLAALGIADRFELTGLYEGLPVGDKHSAPSGTMPDRIRLFRSPILDEWIARGDEEPGASGGPCADS